MTDPTETVPKRQVRPRCKSCAAKSKQKTALEILSDVQRRVVAPKGRRNDFGGFDYRNCEDILMAVKPVVTEHGGAVILTDGFHEIGGRIYVEAVASLHSPDGSTIGNTAYAREPEQKKGMDAMQVTGAASSYARKYALAGLFALDNNKDADSMDNRPLESEQKDAYPTVSGAYSGARADIKKYCDKMGFDPKDVGRWIADRFNSELKAMTSIDQIAQAVDAVHSEYKPRVGTSVVGDIPGKVVEQEDTK